jgi:hypothetical protein
MHKNPFFIVLLAALCAAGLWFFGKAAWALYDYNSYTSSVQAKTIDWNIKIVSEEQFIPYARYTYVVNGTEHTGEGSLKNTVYRNEWAAGKAVEELAKKGWTIWYDPDYPNYSSLQKIFPLKECIYAGTVALLIIYFLGLGFYVAGRQKQGQGHG